MTPVGIMVQSWNSKHARVGVMGHVGNSPVWLGQFPSYLVIVTIVIINISSSKLLITNTSVSFLMQTAWSL